MPSSMDRFSSLRFQPVQQSSQAKGEVQWRAPPQSSKRTITVVEKEVHLVASKRGLKGTHGCLRRERRDTPGFIAF
jgi:hypothetical protein